MSGSRTTVALCFNAEVRGDLSNLGRLTNNLWSLMNIIQLHLQSLSICDSLETHEAVSSAFPVAAFSNINLSHVTPLFKRFPKHLFIGFFWEMSEVVGHDILLVPLVEMGLCSRAPCRKVK